MMNPPHSTRSGGRLFLRRPIFSTLLGVAMSTALPHTVAQTSTWIAPGPSSPAANWHDPSNWDSGTVPNSTAATAIFNHFYSGGDVSSSTLPGTGPTVITAPVTLNELRYVQPDASVSLTTAGIEIGANGELHLTGTGITVNGPTISEVRTSIRVHDGTLHFDNSSSIRGGSLAFIGLSASSANVGEAPGTILFHDTSSAGIAQITVEQGSLLNFLDNSSAGQATISGGVAGASATGNIRFSGQSRAGTARIASSGTVTFEHFASAQNAQLVISSTTVGGPNPGRLVLKDQATAEAASIVFAGSDAILDLSGLSLPPTANNTGRFLLATPNQALTPIFPNDAGGVTLNSLRVDPRVRAGVIYLGSNTLVLGGDNRDYPVIPTVREVGGLYGTADGHALRGGSVIKRGTGVLQITGANEGHFSVVQGELRLLGGSLASVGISGDSGQGGTVAGSGTIGTLNNTFGLIAPGLGNGILRETLNPLAGRPGEPETRTTVESASPIGTLVISGDYRQIVGRNFSTGLESRLAIQIAGPTTSDQITVGGTAFIGGALELSLLDGYFPLGNSSYAFLNAGSVVGTFDHIVFGSGWGYLLQPELIYGTSGVVLRVQPRSLAGIGAAPGERALGAHLDRTLASSTGDYRTLVSTLVAMPSANEVHSALQALSPDAYGSLAEFGFMSALGQHVALQHRLSAWADDSRGADGFNLFFDASYRRTTFQAVNGSSESRFRTDEGVAGGAWRRDRWTVGAELAYNTADGKLDAFGSKADVKSLRPSLFFQYRSDNFFVNAAGGFSHDDYKLSRHIAFTGFNHTAAAKPSGHRVDFSVETGYIAKAGNWNIIPHAGLLHSEWELNDFKESGAPGANFAFSSWSNKSLHSRAGIEVSRKSADLPVRPRATFAWWHEFNHDRSFETQFVGATGSYIAPGRPSVRDLLQASVSLEFALGRHTTLSASAEGWWGADIKTSPGFSLQIGRNF